MVVWVCSHGASVSDAIGPSADDINSGTAARASVREMDECRWSAHRMSWHRSKAARTVGVPGPDLSAEQPRSQSHRRSPTVCHFHAVLPATSGFMPELYQPGSTRGIKQRTICV